MPNPQIQPLSLATHEKCSVSFDYIPQWSIEISLGPFTLIGRASNSIDNFEFGLLDNNEPDPNNKLLMKLDMSSLSDLSELLSNSILLINKEAIKHGPHSHKYAGPDITN